ncbi:hypothetical protein NIES2111_11450 [Nostoc sp. NIES-2111]|nr:hypothetical protein NIES2111_11450 [Nostoc sp. NIES-2111]
MNETPANCQLSGAFDVLKLPTKKQDIKIDDVQVA